MRRKSTLSLGDKIGRIIFGAFLFCVAMLASDIPSYITKYILFEKKDVFSFSGTSFILISAYLIIFFAAFYYGFLSHDTPIFKSSTSKGKFGETAFFSSEFQEKYFKPYIKSQKNKLISMLFIFITVVIFSVFLNISRTELAGNGITVYNYFNKPIETVCYEEITKYKLFAEKYRTVDNRRTYLNINLSLTLITKEGKEFIFDLESNTNLKSEVAKCIKDNLSHAEKEIVDSFGTSYEQIIMFNEYSEEEIKAFDILFEVDRTYIEDFLNFNDEIILTTEKYKPYEMFS